MRTLARLGALVIETGVAVVVAVGGLTAGGLRKLASIGDEGDHPAEAEGSPEAEAKSKA